MANKLACPLITADKDFGELVYRQGRAAVGVVLLRLAGLSDATKADLVSISVAEHVSDLVGAFTVIEAGTVRIRRGAR
jgi:predicted nuclease of predicted toxin-antitoxin system